VFATEQNVRAPFYFYYNPHRYPAFLSGIVASFTDENDLDREDVFIASGGSDHSIADIDQRVQDALKYSGGNYLDAFVLEYVCPEELIKPSNDKSEILTPQAVIEQTKLGTELKAAIVHLQSLVAKGKIRYIMASTHSHFVGAVLCKSKTHQSSHPFLDAIMLRYNLSHKRGAESISFPYALENDVPVLAFT
jgi:aryl-alcohol dehydrogenase-like predicted oxidoreductase